MTHCIIQNTNIKKILKHSKTVCTIQDWCTANSVEKKPDELRKTNF